MTINWNLSDIKQLAHFLVFISSLICMLAGTYFVFLKRKLLKNLPELEKVFTLDNPYTQQIADKLGTRNMLGSYSKAIVNKKYAQKKFPKLEPGLLSPKTKRLLIHFDYALRISIISALICYLTLEFVIPEELEKTHGHHRWHIRL